MGRKQFSIGSSKNIKKEIDVNVTYKHIAGFFLVLILIVIIILNLLVKFNVGVTDLDIKCNNGTIERVEFEKYYYCGEHYTKLIGVLPEDNYNLIKNQIETGEIYD